jgi:hypothetical protein
MKNLFFVLFLLLIIGCDRSKTSTSKLSDFIPNNASVIVKINDLETFKNDFKNNDLLSRLSLIDPYGSITKQLLDFDSIRTKESLLFCLNKNQDSLNFTLITKLTDSLFGHRPLDSITAHFKVIDSFFIASNSKSVLAKIQPHEHPEIQKLIETENVDRSFSFILNQGQSKTLSKTFLNNDQTLFSDQTFLDTAVRPDQIILNGITVSNDTLVHLVNVFKNNVPQENTIQHIVPGNAEGYLSFTYNNFQNLYDNLNSYRSIESDSIINSEILETLNEVGQIYYDNTDLIVLKSIDATATKEALREHQVILTSYRNVSIMEFSETSYFNEIFNPLIQVNEVSKYIALDDYFVFSNSEDALLNIIASYQNGTTMSKSDAFKKNMDELSDESSLQVVLNSERLHQLISELFKTELEIINHEAYKNSVLQLVQDDGFAHINGIIRKHKQRAAINTINEEFNVTLDADIIMDPQFVINHRSKQKEIVVQDVNNTLYLISNTGKILWKKKLIGAILGKIEQVDLFRNDRLQLAFSTPFRVYVIDRNGNHVSPFPLKFGEEITQPLSVFDYDNNRQYRFLVTQDNDLLMYNRYGRFVKGFKYINRNSIKTQPKHFRVGTKDYIVFGAGNTLQIINRQGRTRIKVPEPIDFSGQQIFYYNTMFSTTTADGALAQVQLNGKLTKQALNLDSKHRIDATAKTLVTLSENILSIKKNKIELDFGDYTEPKIFYLNDKIYVSLTDLQSQKIYLFDSQSKQIPHFPVYGNSTIDLANIDADSNLEFVTKGESNGIVVYKKN